jgi:hypothetical protein
MECPATPGESAGLLVDPVRALYDGRVARGEAAATAMSDRIADAKIAVRDRLADIIDAAKAKGDNRAKTPDELAEERKATLKTLQRRLGIGDHTDFFHFRQCRLPRRKSPTMSWHDSEAAWEVLRDMLGLDKDSRDDCGNGAEFFRLCMRLARLSTGMNDHDASNECAKRWPRPANWLCIEFEDGWRCGLPLVMGEPRRAQLMKPGLR